MLIVGIIMAVYGLVFAAYCIGRYTDFDLYVRVWWLNITRPVWRTRHRGR